MIEVVVPRESVNDESVIVQKIFVTTGTVVEAAAPIVEIETSKTTMEITAPVSGSISHDLIVGQEVSVGSLLFAVRGAEEQRAEISTAPAGQASSSESAQANGSAEVADDAPPALLSREAAAIAARVGIDLRQFRGRWVTSSELIQAARPVTRHERSPAAPPRVVSAALETSTESDAPERAKVSVAYRSVARSKRKRAEIQTLITGQHAATASTIGIGITLPGERIVPPPALFRDSISDLIVFEAARLFKDFPELNGWHVDAQTSGYYEEVNFGLSFDNRSNLKVLALRNADRLDLRSVQGRLLELLELYESDKPIPRELLETSTVTLSDLSTTGASYMLPLLNGRQSLIMGIVKGEGSGFQIFASFDHRLTEGLRVTRFLESLRDRVCSHYRDGSGAASLMCTTCGKSMADEIRLGSRGFVRVTLPSGVQANLCRNCFEGH